MRCFNHPDTEAVGLCKHCSKGVCAGCARESDLGLVCSDSCEAEIRKIYRLVDRGSRAHVTTAGTYLRAAIIYGLLGTLFVIAGVVEWIYAGLVLAYFPLIGGVIFLLGAVFQYTTGRRYKE